jgi:hypothetical protein
MISYLRDVANSHRLFENEAEEKSSNVGLENRQH